MWLRKHKPLRLAERRPSGKHWLHEPKWDGFRFQIIKDGSAVRFYSRHGADDTERLPGMRKAFAELPADAAIIDGELCLVDLRGAAHFWQLMTQMRSRWPDENRLMFLAFDLLHQDSADLRSETLTQRKRALDRLCRGAPTSTRSRCSRTARSYLTTATASGSKASCRSGEPRATPAG
jgi:bifunctional non-homologous end joining protein LigD